MFTSSKRVPALIATAAAAALGLTACGGSADAEKSADGKTKVIAGFYPMAWLTEKVGGDKVSVQTLTKPGAEPHDLELTARQTADVSKAGFVTYVKGLQPAVDDAVAKNGKDKSLDAASVVKTLPPPSGAEEEGHDHPSYDPHIWLDPARMATIATALGDKLAAADPADATTYKDNAKKVVTQLNALDQQYQSGLKNCQQKNIVTAHAAFGYMADHYGLKQVSIAGVDPTNEPSPKRLAELTQQIKATGATTVFTETLVSPKVAETLAREAGVKTAVLDPIEGVWKGSTDDYASLMAKNLQTLKTALGCS
ncbi:zinc ABC transporter substrate-binding protein [Actinomadura barringtoniae]|uniref:Zinc ABC transporter substrate-binding protein n=1 Tax=Actinomadura barringtoniae TaxID=1427535 RepID=A0A939T3E4_9ACTN|nr:metal ABC transporter substrate-binding protein [Actinomadura barringtoniae]MBO2446514.1 zinc ABC transporter substrate-binding protein [Actinomadura barringtoniae]